jgi:hypothetical protein
VEKTLLYPRRNFEILAENGFLALSERDAGLLAFGPDLGLTGRWRFRSVAKRVRREADCLVWIAPDG